jgi:hypothetical protein
MIMKTSVLKILYIALTAGVISTSLSGQSSTTAYVPADKLLYDTIASQDSMLFAAFNTRNLEKLKTFFADNLEVYQDNIGVRSYEESLNAFRGLFSQDYILTRHLVKESLEVYPIKDFGAIETGSHTFCHTENGNLECGTFKFVHIWQIQNGRWKITRIITYGHKL